MGTNTVGDKLDPSKVAASRDLSAKAEWTEAVSVPTRVESVESGGTRAVSTAATDESDRTQVLFLAPVPEGDLTEAVSVPGADESVESGGTRAVSTAATDESESTQVLFLPPVPEGDLTQVIPRQRRPAEDSTSLLDMPTTLLPKQAFVEGARLAVARVPESMDRTSLLTPLTIPEPVFVDDSGRRRRLLMVAALVVAVLCLALLGLLWLSQLGSAAHLDLGSNVG